MSCIYALVHPETGELRYIGKADRPAKRMQSHIRDSRRRSTPVCCWIRRLAEEGLIPEMVVLAEGCADWKVNEREFIARGRQAGHRLLNLANGGDMPECPPSVQTANGHRLVANMREARKREDWPGMQGFIAATRRLGQGARYLRSRGNPNAAFSEQLLGRLRAMTREQKLAFGLEFVRQFNWAGK